MFLDELTDTQKRAFIGVAHRLSLSDQILSRREQVLLTAMRGEMAMDLLAVPPQIDETQLTSIFDSRRARLIMLIELLTLAYVDGAFDDQESSYILKISADFGVGSSEVEQMAGWVQEFFRTEARGRSLLGELDKGRVRRPILR